MIGVGRALCGSSSPTPCHSGVTYSRLVLSEATTGGLGSPHPTGGDEGGEEVQCVSHGLAASTSSTLFPVLFFVHLPAHSWKWGGGSKGTPAWRGWQSPQPPAPTAVSPEQGHPALSSSRLRNPPKYSKGGTGNTSGVQQEQPPVPGRGDTSTGRCSVTDPRPWECSPAEVGPFPAPPAWSSSGTPRASPPRLALASVRHSLH